MLSHSKFIIFLSALAGGLVLLIGFPVFFKPSHTIQQINSISTNKNLNQLDDGSYFINLGKFKSSTLPVFSLTNVAGDLDFIAIQELQKSFFRGEIIRDLFQDGEEAKVLSKKTKNRELKIVGAISKDSLYLIKKNKPIDALNNLRKTDFISVLKISEINSDCYHQLAKGSKLTDCNELDFELPVAMEYFKNEDKTIDLYILPTHAKNLFFALYQNQFKVSYGIGKEILSPKKRMGLKNSNPKLRPNHSRHKAKGAFIVDLSKLGGSEFEYNAFDNATPEPQKSDFSYLKINDFYDPSPMPEASPEDTPEPTTCECDMKFFIDTNVIEEGKVSKHQLTFEDRNNCYDPKLIALPSIINGTNINNPPMNHVDNQTKLVMSAKINWGGRSATLESLESLWYGVKKNATDDICFDHTKQSKYAISFLAKFDSSECDSEVEIPAYVTLGELAKANTIPKRKVKVDDTHFEPTSILLGTPNIACTVLSKTMTNPITCSAKEVFKGDPEDYKQLWEIVKKEEEFHSRQFCDPSIPFSKGGYYGTGGPFNINRFFNDFSHANPSGVCIEYTHKKHWWEKNHEKDAIKQSRKIAKAILVNLAHEYISSLLKDAFGFRAWFEWTAKTEVGVTQARKGALHYECAYGRSSKFPDSNPPKPTF